MKLRIATAAILALAVFGISTSHPMQTLATQRTEYGYGDGTTIITDDGNIWGYDGVIGNCKVTFDTCDTPEVKDDIITDVVSDTPLFYVTSIQDRDEYGDIVVEFNDGSWAVINRNAKEYIFQPWVMGDYEYRFSPETDGEWATVRFINCILTYCENMYRCEDFAIPNITGDNMVADMIGLEETDSYYSYMHQYYEF